MEDRENQHLALLVEKQTVRTAWAITSTYLVWTENTHSSTKGTETLVHHQRLSSTECTAKGESAIKLCLRRPMRRACVREYETIEYYIHRLQSHYRVYKCRK